MAWPAWPGMAHQKLAWPGMAHQKLALHGMAKASKIQGIVRLDTKGPQGPWTLKSGTAMLATDAAV